MATALVPRRDSHTADADTPDLPASTAARWATRFHVASLLLAYPTLLWLGRDMWFRLDEWRIVLGHTPAAGPRAIDVFAPFDIHWSTVLVLFYRAVGAVVGASSYLPYMGVALAMHLLSVHLLWRVLRRIGVDPWVAALSASAVLILGAAWEAMYWVLILGYTLPLCLTFGAVLAGDREELQWRHRVAITVLTLLAVMCSGAGVAMIVVPVIVVAMRRRVRDGLLVVAPTAFVYALWLALAGSGILDHPGGASRGMAGTVMRFVWDGLSASMATLLGPVVVGAAALVVVAVWTAERWRRIGVPAAVPACVAGAAAMFVLTALGRANGGDPTLPHYLSTGAILLMPAIALALTDVLHALSRGVVLAALLVVVAHSAIGLSSSAPAAAAEDEQSHRAILAAAAIAGRTTVLPDSYPEPQLAWAVSAADILRLRDRGDLRPPPSLPAAVLDEARLRVHVDIAPARAAAASGAPSRIDLVGATQEAPMPSLPGSPCMLVRTTAPDFFVVAVTFASPGALHITALTPVSLHGFLRGSAAEPSDEVEPMVLLPPGDGRWLNDVEPDSTILLRFTAGVVQLCP